MYKIGENELILCPYNRSHVVSKLRIQKHIIKCQDRHPDVKLVTCFYNYTHKVKPEDILSHYEICSQKIRMEEARYCEDNWHSSCSSSEVSDIPIFGPGREKTHFLKAHETGSVIDNNNQCIRHTPSTSKNQSVNSTGKDYDCEDLRPLNLPKTVSRAFTSVKQQIEGSSGSVSNLESEAAQPKGFGRGRKFFLDAPKPPKSTDQLLPHENGMENRSPEKIQGSSEYLFDSISKLGNNCSASIISSLYDDSTTLKSDNVTLDAFNDDDDDDDDDDEDADADDGFLFNFDKYVRI